MRFTTSLVFFLGWNRIFDLCCRLGSSGGDSFSASPAFSGAYLASSCCPEPPLYSCSSKGIFLFSMRTWACGRFFWGSLRSIHFFLMWIIWGRRWYTVSSIVFWRCTCLLCLYRSLWRCFWRCRPPLLFLSSLSSTSLCRLISPLLTKVNLSYNALLVYSYHKLWLPPLTFVRLFGFPVKHISLAEKKGAG